MILIFFVVKKSLFPIYIYTIYIYICIYNGQKDPPSQMGSSEFLNETKSCNMLRTTQVTKYGSYWATGL